MNYVITAIISILIGFGIGTQLFPKVETKTVTVDREVIKKDIVTQIKVITKPDGTKEEVTLITDKSNQVNLTKNISKVLAKSNYHVSVSGKTNDLKFSEITYTLSVEKRVLGDIFLGLTLDTNKSAGVVLGMEW